MKNLPASRHKTRALSFLLSTTAIFIFANNPALAETDKDVKSEIATLRARLDQLEAQTAASAAAAAKAEALAASATAAVDAQSKTVADGLKKATDAILSGQPVRIVETAGTNVSLYGLLEATVSSVTNSTSRGQTTNGFQVSYFSGNRFGIDASTLLDADRKLKLIAKLESEFELPTGNMDSPGVIFNRDAYVGFQSPDYGKLTFGRQNTLPRDFSQSYGDPYGTAKVTLNEGGYTNVNNFKQLIFFSASATGTRLDSGIVYKHEVGNWVFGLEYGFGSTQGANDTANEGNPSKFNQGSSQAAAIAYNGGAWNANAFYSHANIQGLKNESQGIGGNYTVGIVRMNLGYLHYSSAQGGKLGERDDNAVTTSVKIAPEGMFDYELGLQLIQTHNAGFNAGGNVPNPYGDFSTFSKSQGFGTGDRTTGYGSIFYHPVKNVDLYLAGDYLRTSSGYHAAQTHGFRDATEIASGVRYKF